MKGVLGKPIEVKMKDGKFFSGILITMEQNYICLKDIKFGTMIINKADMQYMHECPGKYIVDKEKRLSR